MEAFFIILTGALVAMTCALLGSFLVLRKMAMLGDAISHAVLPGIVLAFLISGGRDNIIILIGASAAGLLVTLLIELLHKKVRLQEDASIGISFTWLFAIGVILISVYTEQVDLDQDCVLYGEIAYVPLDLIYFSGGKVFFPRAALIAGSLFTVALTFVMVAYKGLKITSFNSDYARSLGISTLAWHLVFMSLVSVTTVLSFEIVGAILIVALLVVPPATAYLLTKRLKQMLILSLLFACLSAIGGYYLALVLDASIAGAMVTVAGFFFLLALIFTRLRRSSLKVDMRL
ncbi:MAG: manganese/zinc/iron transport system permease protein [Roseivirga sp.]|jgi:manganese/zinc/iron transport system permease protein